MKEKKRKYRQIKEIDREGIWKLKLKGKSSREIAKELSFSHTTISRELKKNSFRGMIDVYSPAIAYHFAKERRCKRGRKKQILCPGIRQYVSDKLEAGWSPEQIAGRITRDHPELRISHETIYQYVFAHQLHHLLPTQRPKRKPRRKKRLRNTFTRSHIPNRIGIDQRPNYINQRKVFGHWESDLIISKQNSVALNVLVERQSRLVKITRVERKTADQTSSAIIKRLIEIPPKARQSITYDNGSEFASHELINQNLKTRSFFCNPYSSWEKGSVENMNGLIRRYIKKGEDLANYTPDQISTIESALNNRPKKLLKFRTPLEVYTSKIASPQSGASFR